MREAHVYGKSAWIFPSPLTDSCLHTENVNKLWYRLRSEAGLCDVRLHDLRHSWASMALAQGETILTISRLLGHRDPETTLQLTSSGRPWDAQIWPRRGSV